MDFETLDRAVESGSYDPKFAAPRLPVYFVSKKLDASGKSTPPVRPQGAVPFDWEQAPGRPKDNYHPATTNSKRHGLLPKMAATAASSACYSASPSSLSTSTSSSSSRSSSLTYPFSSCTGGEESKDDTKEAGMRFGIRRYRSEGTLNCYTASHFWTTILGRLQAAVPWKRDRKL